MNEAKYCPRCNEKKELGSFYRRSAGGVTSYCKTCHIAQAVERQREIKIQCVDYKGGSCTRCGYDRYYGALEFHHKDPTEKDFAISGIKTTKFGPQHTIELDKCDILCACCHREVHAELRGEAMWADGVRSSKELHYNREAAANKRLPRACVDCDDPISYGATRCRRCASRRSNAKRTKIKWPPTDRLVEMVAASNYSAVGRKLGVTCNAIRKRIKNHA